MSGRGKGGKALGADRKRAKIEEYEWVPEQRVAVVSHAIASDGEVNSWIIPFEKLHFYFKKAMLRIEKEAEGELSNVVISIDLNDEDANYRFFEVFKNSDLVEDEASEEQASDDERGEDDEDDEVEDRRQVMEELNEWLQDSTPQWNKMPPVPVCIGAKILFNEE